MYYPHASPCPGEPWALTCVHPDVLMVPRKHNFLRSTFGRPVLATSATKKEYSGRLGSQNCSKMEPKMEPRRRRPTLTKHVPAWTDRMSTPPGELHFRSLFQSPQKYHQTLRQKSTIQKHGAKLAPKVVPNGCHYFAIFVYQPIKLTPGPAKHKKVQKSNQNDITMETLRLLGRRLGARRTARSD